MSTRTEHTHQVTRIEVVMEASYTNFTHAFESLLGRMPVEALSGLPAHSAQAAREQLASYVGPLDFTLFQKLDHGAIVTALAGRPCKATTYVFGNALIAVEDDETRRLGRPPTSRCAYSSRRLTRLVCASLTTCPRPSWPILDPRR